MKFSYRRAEYHSAAVAYLLAGAELMVTRGKVDVKELKALAGKWKSLAPIEYVIGGRSVAIIVHPSNRINSLTPMQLKSIFSGKTKSWNILGGAGGVSGKIRRYGVRSPDASAFLFGEKVLSLYSLRAMRWKKTAAEVIKAVASDRRGIGFVGFTDVTALGGGVKVLGIGSRGKAVRPNAETIKSGAYPFAEVLMLYVSPKAGTAAKNFARFITSGRCDAMCRENGYVPALRKVERDVESVVKKLFGGEMSRAAATEDPSDDIRLAERMLKSARDSGDDPELQAALCEAARKLAIRAPAGQKIAIEAMEFMASKVPGRRAEAYRRITVIRERAYEADGSPQSAARLIDSLFVAATVCVNNAQGDYVRSLCDQAVAIAKEARPDTLDQVKRKRAAFAARCKVMAELASLKGKDDAKSRRRKALIYLAELDNPAEAAKFLTPSSPAAMRTNIPLASMAADKLSPNALLTLADWYVGLIEQAGPAGKALMARRAADYYERFLRSDGVSADDRAVGRLGLGKARKILFDCVLIPTDTAARGADLAGDWSDALANIRIYRDALGWGWKRNKAILSLGHGYRRLAIPAICDGSYKLKLSFIRQSGGDYFGVVLPCGKASVTLVLNFKSKDGKNKRITGLDRLAGKTLGGASSGGIPCGDLSLGREHRLDVEVTLAGDNVAIRTYLDDRPYFKWSGPQSELSAHRRMPINQPGLIGLNSPMRFTRILIKGARLIPGPFVIRDQAELKLPTTTTNSQLAKAVANNLALRKLSMPGCGKLTSYEPLGKLKSLRELNLSRSAVANLSPLARLPKLESLNLSGWDIENLSILYGVTQLTSLNLGYCRKLEAVGGVERIEGLKRLDLAGCTMLSDLTPLAGLRKLEYLRLDGCTAIKDFRPLRHLRSLKELSLNNIDVNDAQIGALKRFLRGCKIRHRPPKKHKLPK